MCSVPRSVAPSGDVEQRCGALGGHAGALGLGVYPTARALRLASLQAVPGMARFLLRLSRSHSPYLSQLVSLLSGAFHLKIPF